MQWVVAVILGVTYAGVAFTRLPRVPVDRPAAAFAGAVAMVLLGVLSYADAVAAIDFHTIGLLLGMMLVVAALEKMGLVTYLARRLLAVGTTPWWLLAVVVAGTAVLSAFLVNDAVVLFFTPRIDPRDAAPEGEPRALPDRRGDGFERGLHGDDRRQPAERVDRHRVRH
ncbi:MAG: hypothetical protein FJ318_04480 [SAR202 cluster bacterium]|nr:hypothetical protein [SAR202 cluster bacterium]